jgi:hypothetical protein
MRLKADTRWDVTIEVGGMFIPTLSPTMVGEADALRTQTTPGALVRAWQWLFGAKAPSHETEQVRSLCRMFVAPMFHELLERLNGGELVALYSAYMGASAAWAGRMRAEAEEAAEREVAKWRGGEVEKAHGSASRATAPGAGNNTVLWPATPLRGGQPVPAVLHGLGVNEVNGRPVGASGEMASGEVGQETA